MTIELKQLTQTILIFVGITLILRSWRPPIHKSRQAVIAFFLGIGFGYFLEPTKDGVVTGIIASQIVFWGEDYFKLIRATQKEIQQTTLDNEKDGEYLKKILSNKQNKI